MAQRASSIGEQPLYLSAVPDIPIPGDYDGDGKFDVGIYRIGVQSEISSFIILRSSDGTMMSHTTFNYGTTVSIVPGDYDGDGKFDFATSRMGISGVAPRTWEILQSSNGQTRTQTFGISSDISVQGDYDGDARTDIAIYRRGILDNSPSTFWIFRSFDNTAQSFQWGVREDLPIAAFDSR